MSKRETMRVMGHYTLDTAMLELNHRLEDLEDWRDVSSITIKLVGVEQFTNRTKGITVNTFTFEVTNI